MKKKKKKKKNRANRIVGSIQGSRKLRAKERNFTFMSAEKYHHRAVPFDRLSSELIVITFCNVLRIPAKGKRRRRKNYKGSPEVRRKNRWKFKDYKTSSYHTLHASHLSSGQQKRNADLGLRQRDCDTLEEGCSTLAHCLCPANPR